MRLKIAAVLVVTVLCLGSVLWKLDADSVVVSLGDFRWAYMVPVLLSYAFAHGLRVVRLRAILGRHVPFVRLLSIISIGYLAINVVPLRMGEFVRPTLLAEKEEIPFGAGLAAILVERLVDMLMLLGMMLLVSFAVELPESGVVVEGIDVLRAGQKAVGSLAGVGIVGLGVLVAVGEPLLRLTDRLPLGGFLRRFREGILMLSGRPTVLVTVFATSVVIWAVTIVAVYLTLLAFPGLPASAGNALTVWTVTLTGMTVVPTPGFFGGFEASCSAVLRLLGVHATPAGTFAVLLHLGQFGFTVGAGLLFLVWEGVSLREVVARSRSSVDRGAA